MVAFLARLRALLFFYRSAAPFMLGITGLIIGCVQLPSLVLGWAKFALSTLLFIKLLTAPAVWYLSEQQQPHQYWFYFNMGLSRSVLWGSIVGLDFLLFLVFTTLLNLAVA
jgi:hypothetical protein